jgi:hypothetical protein
MWAAFERAGLTRKHPPRTPLRLLPFRDHFLEQLAILEAVRLLHPGQDVRALLDANAVIGDTLLRECEAHLSDSGGVRHPVAAVVERHHFLRRNGLVDLGIDMRTIRSWWPRQNS